MPKLGVLDKKFFLSYEKKKYFPINEFFEPEEIYPSLFTINSNLESIQFKSISYKKKLFWGIINYKGKGPITLENLKLSQSASVVKKSIFR